MEQMIFISVQSEADLLDIEPNKNFMILVQETNELFRGNDTGIPIKVSDEGSTIFAHHFLFMGG